MAVSIPIILAVLITIFLESGAIALVEKADLNTVSPSKPAAHAAVTVSLLRSDL